VQTISEEDQACVFADRQRLKQTLLNLVSNAIKYNSKDGKVTISGASLPQVSSNGAEETSDNSSANIFRISVADTGVGIPPEKLQRLFTPFDRLDAEATSVEGTGLGLALSKKMTELMGGTLGVESTLGQGSIFSIDLPSAECPVKALGLSDALALTEVLTTSTQTVVYIEDNLSNLNLIRAILNLRTGIKLFTAMQGSLGIDLVREHSPNLVLLDLNLPDLSGYEVLARLRGDPKTKSVPILMLTADATAGQKERLLAAGANSFLTKPLDIPAFLKVVDELLGHNASDTPGIGDAIESTLAPPEATSNVQLSADDTKQQDRERDDASKADAKDDAVLSTRATSGFSVGDAREGDHGVKR
jgi:CheY-like chemotaxis protein